MNFRAKSITPLFLFVLLHFALSAQTTQEEEQPLRATQFGVFLMIDSPFKTITPYMSTAGLFGFSIAHSPFIGSPLFIELKLGFGTYANSSNQNVYYAKNNYWYPAESYYKSGYQKYLLGPKFMIGQDFRKIRMFATPQIGLIRMNSKTVVKYWDGTSSNNDNSDGSDQVSKSPVKSTHFGYGAEAGVEVSLQRLFKPESEENTFRLLLSGSFLRGFNEYRYSDVDEMLSSDSFGDDPIDPNQYQLISHPNVDEIKYVKVNSSLLQLWGVNLGLTINF
jgi:hypothetical protein